MNQNEEKIQSFQIVYFSGTGGAKRIADAFEQECKQNEILSKVFAIDRSNAQKKKGISPLPFEHDSLTLLIFAVHAFDAPQPVYDWIKSTSFPPLSKFAVISVSGGGEVWPNTGCRWSVIKALDEKGCNVVYDAMMVMPSNMNPSSNDDAAMWVLKAYPLKVHAITEDLLAGKRIRTRYKLDPIRSFITEKEKKGANKFSETIQLSEKCTGCSWCANNCPQDNIEMKDNKPQFKNKCVACFRCIYGCPVRALSSKNAIVIQSGYSISDVEKRMSGASLKPISQCCHGLFWGGVRKYLYSIFPEQKEKHQ